VVDIFHDFGVAHFFVRAQAKESEMERLVLMVLVGSV